MAVNMMTKEEITERLMWIIEEKIQEHNEEARKIYKGSDTELMISIKRAEKEDYDMIGEPTEEYSDYDAILTIEGEGITLDGEGGSHHYRSDVYFYNLPEIMCTDEINATILENVNDLDIDFEEVLRSDRKRLVLLGLAMDKAYSFFEDLAFDIVKESMTRFLEEYPEVEEANEENR